MSLKDEIGEVGRTKSSCASYSMTRGLNFILKVTGEPMQDFKEKWYVILCG